MFDTPILLLVFNRPYETQLVFKRIRSLKPKFLFVAADGPRINKIEDEALCEKTRRVVLDHIDWDCQVFTRLQVANLGCGRAVSSAITWFFDNVDRGIILEDDILPDESFFPFCADMLERYADDERVMTISGSNYIGSWKKDDYSYFFSKYGPIWGWATWKRFWDLYDFDMKSWPAFKAEHRHLAFCDNDYEVRWRENIFDCMYEKKIDTWDFQMVYAKLSQNGLSIVPCTNLVCNIGFGETATHTRSSIDPRSQLPVAPMSFPLTHNPYVIPDKEADDCYFKQVIFHKRKLFETFSRYLRWGYVRSKQLLVIGAIKLRMKSNEE